MQGCNSDMQDAIMRCNDAVQRCKYAILGAKMQSRDIRWTERRREADKERLEKQEDCLRDGRWGNQRQMDGRGAAL